MGRSVEQDSGPLPLRLRTHRGSAQTVGTPLSWGANDVLLLICFAQRDGEKAVKREVSCLHTPGNQGRSINAT